jgi:DNA modification methylase
MTDPRNRLNDLTNREWVQETKSFWLADGGNGSLAEPEVLEEFSRWLRETRGDEQAERLLGQLLGSRLVSVNPPRGGKKIAHPATFSERDVERLIRFFTKPGELVLDPFVGSGSTLLAARACGRAGLGLELIPQWAQLARERAAAQDDLFGQTLPAQVRQTDALAGLQEMPADSVDFIVTSPPYWRILRKRPGMKAQQERQDKGLTTHYSEDPADLGNVADYGDFLARLGDIFAECGRVLRPNRYLAVIVSDFRDGRRFVLYHADVAAEVERRGLALKGVTILLQDDKNLYPYAIPYAFVSNIHHQYILVFQKPKA